jgi:hypothetical protein
VGGWSKLTVSLAASRVVRPRDDATRRRHGHPHTLGAQLGRGGRQAVAHRARRTASSR